MDLVLSALWLCGATVLWWIVRQQGGPPAAIVCRHCGDLLQVIPGLPVRCPSCGRWVLG